MREMEASYIDKRLNLYTQIYFGMNYDDVKSTLLVGSFCSLAFYFMSLRWGTPEMMVYFRQTTGRLGAVGVSLAIVRDELLKREEELGLTTPQKQI